ncbi:MAG: signal peptide peptidase SppA [Geminicoccaceae bacterium]
MRVVRRIVVALLAIIGTFTLLAVAATAFAVWRLKLEPQALPDRILLTADWRASLGETAGPPDLLNMRFRPAPTVTDTVLALDAAAKDPRVRGLVVRLAETEHGFAVAQELREAVLRFRAAGKFAIAEADTFGELGSGNEGYYIATACELIALQPGGLVGLTGIGVQVPFARDLLASLGIRMEVLRRAEFKSAFESLTDSAISGPNRLQLEALLDSLNKQLVTAIAEQRRLSPEQVQALIDRAPLSADEAKEAKLVDMLYYHDQVMTSALGRAQGSKPVDLDDYGAAGISAPAQPAARVALVRAAGLIRRGEGALGTEIAADDLVENLEDIAHDPGFAAVLLRLDTGGGSAVASESIRRALIELRGANKPVIVSMSNTAASGGYWIAMGAERVIAQPATLTGSIGVIGGKPVLEELWRKLGVNWATITRGAHAGDWSVNEPFSDSARARVDALIGWLYDRFTSLVAEARGLPQQRVDEIARGRVWSGEDAARLGLVDETGGLDEALAAVRQSLKLPADAPLAISVRPVETNPLRAFLRSLSPVGAYIRALLAPNGQLAAIAPPFSAR